MSVPLVLFAVLSAVIVAGGVTITVTALVVFIHQRSRALVPLLPTASETLRCSQTDGVVDVANPWRPVAAADRPAAFAPRERRPLELLTSE